MSTRVLATRSPRRVEGSGDPSLRASVRRATSPGDDAPQHNRRGQRVARPVRGHPARTHSGGRITKRDFESHLREIRDPPAALRDVTVVLVGTEKAGNVGAVARAYGSFECEDCVWWRRGATRTRASLSAAKGAQHIVHGAGVWHAGGCLLDVDTAVAFHVWCEGLEPARARDVDALVRAFRAEARKQRKDAFLFHDDDDDDDDDEDASDAISSLSPKRPRKRHVFGVRRTRSATPRRTTLRIPCLRARGVV